MKNHIGMKPGEPKTEVVVFCKKLNIREQPNSNAKILGTVSAGSEVIIDESESTADFYKICGDLGTEGFCMKQFIAVDPQRGT